jgi:hypothetical protein
MKQAALTTRTKENMFAANTKPPMALPTTLRELVVGWANMEVETPQASSSG